MRIGLLNNLRAGRNDAQVNRMLQFIGQHPEIAHVETGRSEVVPEALSELARQDIDILVINGGDGTIQYALTEILADRVFGDRVPLIAPVRGGRTNMTASDIGARRDPVKALADIITSIQDGTLTQRIVNRKVLRVEFGQDRRVQYGMFFGLGLIHRAIELNHRMFTKGQAQRAQGAIGASIVTAGLLGRMASGDSSGLLAPDKVQMLVDGGGEESSEHYLLIASTLGRLFSRMQPFWGEGAGDYRLTTMSSQPHRLGWAIPGILRGKPRPWVTPDNGYGSRNVDLANFRFDCGFTIDGELWEPDAGRILSLTARENVRFLRA